MWLFCESHDFSRELRGYLMILNLIWSIYIFCLYNSGFQFFFSPVTVWTKNGFHVSAYLGYINSEVCVLELLLVRTPLLLTQ